METFLLACKVIKFSTSRAFQGVYFFKNIKTLASHSIFWFFTHFNIHCRIFTRYIICLSSVSTIKGEGEVTLFWSLFLNESPSFSFQKQHTYFFFFFLSGSGKPKATNKLVTAFTCCYKRLCQLLELQLCFHSHAALETLRSTLWDDFFSFKCHEFQDKEWDWRPGQQWRHTTKVAIRSWPGSCQSVSQGLTLPEVTSHDVLPTLLLKVQLWVYGVKANRYQVETIQCFHQTENKSACYRVPNLRQSIYKSISCWIA